MLFDGRSSSANNTTDTMATGIDNGPGKFEGRTSTENMAPLFRKKVELSLNLLAELDFEIELSNTYGCVSRVNNGV